ncbi:pericentrin [Aplochiton taeniatus]
MDEDERQRKLEFGRAKKSSNMPRSQPLASFRQRRAKGDGAGTSKKTQKRKGQAVPQNDCSTQDCPLEAVLQMNDDTQQGHKINHEKPQLPTETHQVSPPKNQSSQGPKAQSHVQDPTLSIGEEFGEEDLTAFSGKEQLKQLQKAVEKRNEIISRLSSNLQEAQASRDQVQQEALSLAGQIQALQRQLQQTSTEFLRIKSQAGGSEPSQAQQQSSQPGFDSHSQAHNHTAALPVSTSHAEMEALLNGLRTELEQERKEREDLLSQLCLAQTQCLEIQLYKEEKEVLNREVQELRRKLQEEEEAAERRLREEVADFTVQLQSLERERERQEEEMTRLREEHQEEVQRIRQLLEDREHEESGLKASKNKQNQAGDAAPQSPSPWFNDHSSLSGSREVSQLSDPGEPSDLGKELLIQQCGDLREEMALREREQEVLQEEVRRSAEELEEARSRWAQVTEELQEALWQLEEEKERKRMCEEELEGEREKLKKAEEAINLKVHEEDNLKNKLSALLKEREAEELGREKENSQPGKEPEELMGELKEVRDEKAALLSRLKQQESLVSSLQEMKQAGDTVTSEVQSLFGKQLQALQAHRDKVISELEETKAKHKTTAALLGQKTMELDAVLKDLNTTRTQMESVQRETQRLKGEMEERGKSLERAKRERSELESQLVCLKQNLVNLEEAQAQGAREREEQRIKEEEMDGQMKKMEEVLEEELEAFEEMMGAKETEVAEQREKWEEERQEKEEELHCVRRLLDDQRREREEEVRALLERQVQAVEEATERLRRSHQEEIEELQEKHREELSELETELSDQKAAMEEEQKRQISLIKQVTEREHQRTVSELCAKQSEELSCLRVELSGELRESMEAAHQAELLQAQTQHSLELEALRLSLTNLHAGQLELSQTNLQREREAALSEVQASLREKWAQESAVLQARQQFELDRIREQSQEQQERQRELHQRSIEELGQQRESLISQERMEDSHAKHIQSLRLEWEQEAERTQVDLQSSLSEAEKRLREAQASLTLTQAELNESRARLEELQASSEKEMHKMEEELTQAWSDRDAAACAVEDLVSSHKTVLQDREKHISQLEEKEKDMQQEVLHLQKDQTTLKENSEQEVAHLWAQLESMRTSRQELGELKEQLLARSSRVEDLEHLKAEFNDQRREIREQNEAELESLRRYFEQRLRVAEEGYREEIALLQLRLVEGALEDSVIKTGDASFMSVTEGEEEKTDMLAEITFKLEKHKEELDSLRLQLEERHTQEMANLRSSMALTYREELLQMRTDLTDRYYHDLQELKNRHALELEQLRARLSDSHVRELTRVRLEATRQVELEVEQRVWRHSEELQSRLHVIQTLENRLSTLTQQHAGELQRNACQLKREFAEELRVNVGKVQKEERARLEEEVTSRSQEEVQKLKKELQATEEACLSALREELEQQRKEERRALEGELAQEREKLEVLQASLDNDQNPQVLAVRQRLEAQYDNELRRVRSCMAAEVKELTALLQEQGEEKLSQAQERFQEEKGQLEQCLVQDHELSLGELRDKLQGDMELQRNTVLTNHTQEMDKLKGFHQEQLHSLSTMHRDQLAAMAIELDSEHKAELAALETNLESKRNTELDGLEDALQETNRAQLEAQEAELERRHQEERDELEKRMLGNMDTLEATYLKEIQTLRDEMFQHEQEHQQEVNRLKAEHTQKVELEQAHQLSVREELRRELAQVHMEKFSAMATELSHAHQTELATQKDSLDAEHCQALETLRKQVLELEKQHGTSLQELSNTYSTEREQLNAQHQLQVCELRGISARELEACCRELEEESSRQRMHCLEEAELLKVQLEERLQERIGQLKAEFELKKEAELEEQRRGFSSEHEQKERSFTEKMSQLTAQLRQLDTVVSQLREEVGCLQGELEGKRVEMDTLDTLLQRRDRESQEGGNLLKMLTEDLHTAKEERRELLQANEKLRKVVLAVLRSTMATEELIGHRVNAHVGAKKSEELSATQKSCGGNRNTLESGVSVAEVSEDLELSHRLCESLLLSDTLVPPGGEEAALGACSRLRHTVDALLHLLNQANAQLEQTHGVHLSMEERFSQGRQDSAQLLQQHKHLLEQLDQEAGQKSQLQLEYHKAEGLLEGFVAEKAMLEETLQQKEAQEASLVEELEGLRTQLYQAEVLNTKLEGLKAQHQELSEQHAVLLRQRDHLTADLGEREKGLLAETDRLAQERLDVQRQAEKDHSTLSLRLKALETELEEQETRVLETEMEHRAHIEDLSQQVQALEKQLKHDRQFIDEQAVEREHERDEFQQEIHRLEAQLRPTARGHATGDNKGQRIEELVLQVESLQALIKDKMEDHASLLAANQQAQCDAVERNEEIDKLAGRIRDLEQALLNSSENSRTVSQLEQELHRVTQREQELSQDKQVLEQQQLSSRLQISALQSKLDETRHRYHSTVPDATQQLRDVLDAAQQNLKGKEQLVETLSDQLEKVQRDLSLKEAELKHLTLQLEQITNQNAAHVSQLQEQITTLKENVSTLTICQEEREVERERREEEEDEGEEESLSSALLQDKNHEIDHLNQEVQRLRQEMVNARDNQVVEAELEDLRSQVEHLHCDIIRLRQGKQEEEERLHEVISTLQAELATLGPALHEVSDSQDGDSVNPSLTPSPEPFHCPRAKGKERRGEPDNLKQELRLTHSTATHTLRSRLEALQSQLEVTVGEKEAMERLLLTQEQEYRAHGEELGMRLREEREKAEELRGLLSLKEAELEEVKAGTEEQQLEKEGKIAALEEERLRWQAQAQEMSALCGEKTQLESLVLDLQREEEESSSLIETLRMREEELGRETEALREASRTLERQVQEARSEVLAVERLVAEGREEAAAMETVKKELFAERNALRKRERPLQEEIERLRQEVTSLMARLQELGRLENKGANQEAQKEVLTHAEVTLAKADSALRQREAELARLGAEHQALRAELAAVKEGLNNSTERAEKLLEEGQTKDRALADLETNNKHLKAELRGLQEDLAVQEEELAYQQRELLHLRQRCNQQDTPLNSQGFSQKGVSPRVFEEVVCVSRSEASLSSPEVLRRLECSEDRIRDGFHTSAMQSSRLSVLSALNSTGLELPHTKASPRGVAEESRSRTITPEPASRSTRSPGSISASDNLSMLDSQDVDKLHDLDNMELTAPSSPLGSTSSLSAPEWASDGYGSNVSSELGVRLRAELEQTERLDAQFIEYLRCRGMNPTANTDSAAGSMSYSDELLSPELQDLLKRVYQESCRILALSHRRSNISSSVHLSNSKALPLDQTLCPSDSDSVTLDQARKSASVPPMNWQQEKRALQETVIALRELLCRMAQRDTRADSRGESDWQRELAWVDGQAETQLRVELEQSREQLNSAHHAQQEQQNKIQTLRLAVEECEEVVRREQARVQELQQQLELERTHTMVAVREEQQRREVIKRQRNPLTLHIWNRRDVKSAWTQNNVLSPPSSFQAARVSAEQQSSETVALKGQVEQEKVTCSNLRRELQIEHSRSLLLEKRLDEAHKDLEEERHRSTRQQELQSQERNRLERLLSDAESRLADAHTQLAHANRKLEEERDHSSRQLDDLTRRQEADAVRDRKFMSDMRSQLEQERRQGEELAAVTDRLRAELLQSRRHGEEEDRRRREESQREQEAAARLRVAMELLKDQKQEASRVLEAEREHGGRQGAELKELKEKLRLLKENEREGEEQRERERRREKQEQVERERRHERTSNNLCELELLRQQDQQRMRELQQTLAELEREEREMAAQRLAGSAPGPQQARSTQRSQDSSHTETTPSTSTLQNHQSSSSSSGLMERLLKENSELTERVTELSQERVTLKHTLSCVERQLRRSETELAKVTTETENRPVIDTVSHSKVQRLYERYLRAESFRKSLVYQKRYLLLLLGGFQDCEQATLCLIARMGAHPSPPIASQCRPLSRFRAAVRVVVAISRLKFLTRKWQRAIKRGVSTSSTVNGLASGPRMEVLKQHHPGVNHNSLSRENSPTHRDMVSPLIPPIKSPFRLHSRPYSSHAAVSERSAGTSRDAEQSLTNYIHHLEKVQQRLGGVMPGSSSPHTHSRKSDH